MHLVSLLEELYNIDISKLFIFSHNNILISYIKRNESDFFSEVEIENYRLELFYNSPEKLNDNQINQIKLILLSCTTTFNSTAIIDVTYLLESILSDQSIEKTLDNTLLKLITEDDIFSAGLYLFNSKLFQLRGLLYQSKTKTLMKGINFKKEIIELKERNNFSDILFFEQIKEVDELNNELFPYKNYGIGIYTNKGPLGLLVISTKEAELSKINNLLVIYSKILAITFSFKSLIQRYKFAVNDLDFFKNNLFYNNNLINLGKLTASIAHELKNPLVSIGGFTERVIKLNTDERLNTYLKIIKNEVNRMEQLINDLLLYSKSLKLSVDEINILSLVEEVLTILYEKIKEKEAEVKLHINNTETLNVDKSKIMQVLVNIIKNSLDAFSDTKNNIIEIRSFDNEKYKILEITDNAGGIPTSELPKIFTPFYTTKENGTGLGLPICKKIMEAHGGDIKIFSENNQTKIQLFFKKEVQYEENTYY